MRTTREHVIAVVVFSGDMPELDVDRAALELEQAGYRVARLPDKLGARLYHPLDDFLEAIIEVAGPADDGVIYDIQEQVDSIVDPYGGLVAEFGLLEPNHVSFADCFGPDPVIVGSNQ